jgi:hypothetical protein
MSRPDVNRLISTVMWIDIGSFRKRAKAGLWDILHTVAHQLALGSCHL